jgi:hypothetical protein
VQDCAKVLHTHRSGNPAPALRAFVPHVQEVVVAGGRNVASSLPGCAIQSRPNLLFGLRQFSQRHLQRGACLQAIEVPENRGDDQLVLSIPALRHFRLHQFRKLGFIKYNGSIEIYTSLLSVVLHD